jgi:hypothetical protein
MKTSNRPARPARCEGCSILVGPGYLSRESWPALDGRGILCGSCHEYLRSAASRGRDALQLLNAWRRDVRTTFGASPFLYSRVG